MSLIYLHENIMTLKYRNTFVTVTSDRKEGKSGLLLANIACRIINSVFGWNMYYGWPRDEIYTSNWTENGRQSDKYDMPPLAYCWFCRIFFSALHCINDYNIVYPLVMFARNSKKEGDATSKPHKYCSVIENLH